MLKEYQSGCLFCGGTASLTGTHAGHFVGFFAFWLVPPVRAFVCMTAHACSRGVQLCPPCCRLDAIGAIGIARCFSFGGKFQQPLHDPTIPPREKLTKATYMDSSTKLTSINHFYEKLLKLQVRLLACCMSET